MPEIIAILTFPAKIIAMALLAVFARIFHEEEKLTWSNIATRVVMSTFVLWVTYILVHEYIGLSENISLVISGALSFAFREVLDLFLKMIVNPETLKKWIIRKW